MRLVCSCIKCKSIILIRSDAGDRFELRREYENKLQKCKKCGKKFKLRINEVYARKSSLSHIYIMITLIVVVVLCAIFMNRYDMIKLGAISIEIIGVLIGLPFLLYFAWANAESESINLFNKNYV